MEDKFTPDTNSDLKELGVDEWGNEPKEEAPKAKAKKTAKKVK